MELRDVNLIDQDQYVTAVPHDMFEVLRNEAPVFWHEEPEGVDRRGRATGPGFWAVTRYDDVGTVSRDWKHYSSELGGVDIPTPGAEELENYRQMMIMMDPTKHTKLRLLVNNGFTPRMIGQLEARVRDITADIVNKVIDRGECDFVLDVAAELPLQVIAELMGVPHEDRHDLFRWSNALNGFDDPEYQTTEDAFMDAYVGMCAYANQLADQRRRHPRDDIVSALVSAEVDGKHLSELEFNLFFVLLVNAGNETTRNLVSHAMLALIEHPDQYRKLVADPSLMPVAVEEFLRWGSPVMHFRRTATAAVELRGQKINQGDKVVIWYISANHDADVFPDPYAFDITRQPNEHLAFGGGGPHFCLGANLARLEIRLMFEEIIRRLPDMQLAGPVQRLRSNFINGIKHMPVQFTPVPVPATW